jgi:hypothetical protein
MAYNVLKILLIFPAHLFLTVLFLYIPNGKVLADFDVELDVFFKDSTLNGRYLYVLEFSQGKSADTLAVFDSLAFNRQDRISLFYNSEQIRETKLVYIDTSGLNLNSKIFKPSPGRTTFAVSINRQNIKIVNKDFAYPQKNEDEQSYLYYLSIFVFVKILIAMVFIFASTLPKRLISISSGTFLLSVLIDWNLPLHYFIRFLITALAEFLLISLIGRKHISWLQSVLLVIIVNIAGFGIILGGYLLYVFW